MIRNFRIKFVDEPLSTCIVSEGGPDLPIESEGSIPPLPLKLLADIEIHTPISDRPRPPTRVPWEGRGTSVVNIYNYRDLIPITNTQRQLALHIHIPKCGGTTFRREILPRWYPDKNSRVMVRDVFAMNYVERDALYCAPPALIERLLLISGHDSYGSVPEPKKGFLPICFFRDPFDRGSSLWNHHSKGDSRFGMFLRKLFKEETDFLYRSDLMQDYWRSFLGFEELIHYASKRPTRTPGHELRDIDPDFYKDMEVKARSRINDLPFVLLTEKFDESMVYMHLVHGFPMVPYQRQRVMRSQEDIDALQARKGQLRGDMPDIADFYANIEARFNAQIKDLPDFEKHLASYQEMNANHVPTEE